MDISFILISKEGNNCIQDNFEVSFFEVSAESGLENDENDHGHDLLNSI